MHRHEAGGGAAFLRRAFLALSPGGSKSVTPELGSYLVCRKQVLPCSSLHTFRTKVGNKHRTVTCRARTGLQSSFCAG